ncbi:OsmC family protein [Mycobacterium sp. Y57]|uniref:OsmC family protein n=1 Tax=Mycolicibacterium xanthum TaxID=2796469 RepID=UPI001C8433B9|nr:OsmC family protein [Mycolicibacterium xanthum]MBX7435102.1 OsmC family protein [Mycolicibacterium xanthum]
MTVTIDRGAHNGVDVDAIREARTAMTGQPAAAQFQWRVRNTWHSGIHSQSTIDDYFGVGAEQSHRQPFTIDTDHPELFAAEDNGPTPVEVVLAALAGCLTGGVASVAANRDITLRSVSATLTAEMDLQGVLGIDADVRNGFSSVTVTYDIDADATPEEIEAVVAQSQKRSAVFDLLTNPTTVVVEVG